MPARLTDLDEREAQLGEILAALIESVEGGATPNRHDWLARHPTFAAELNEFFDSEDRLRSLAAPLRAVVYRGVALRLKYDLRDGLRVIARGRLSVYTPRGEYQLLIEDVQPKGVGPLELAFRQLKERLSALGYFEPERKKPVPRVPRRVALVTSPTGSAVRDVLEVLCEARTRMAAELPAAALLGRRQAIFTEPVELHPGAVEYYRDERG